MHLHRFAPPAASPFFYLWWLTLPLLLTLWLCTDVRAFNLMFKTSVGATTVGNDVYLRPETAQGIFVNFQQVYNSMRRRLPFGTLRPHFVRPPTSTSDVVCRVYVACASCVV
jgi:hypothetical protein